MSETQQQTGDEQKATHHKVFVGNVPYLCTDEEFVQCFDDMEGFVSADVVKKHNSRFSRGFGFVTFETKEQAEAIIANDSLSLKGRVLRFSLYQYDKEERNYLVFVRGVPVDMDADSLKKALDVFGSVTEVTLNCNRETGKSIGSASVGYSSLDEMRAALQSRELEVAENVTLQLYPYRKNPRQQRQNRAYRNARAAYMAGFQAGHLTQMQNN